MLFEGTFQAETIVGTRRNDLVFGNGGADIITTKGGNDKIVARGQINAMNGRDSFFSIDFFRVFEERLNNTLTTPIMGNGRDLVVIDGHNETQGGTGAMGFSGVDLGPGGDKLILGSAQPGITLYLGEGADEAYLLGDTYVDMYLGSSKTSGGTAPVADTDADQVHYNVNDKGGIIRAFGSEDTITIYNSGLNYRTALERSDLVNGSHKITFLDGTDFWINTSFDELLSPDQLKFVNKPLVKTQRVYVAGEEEMEKAKFGSFDDDDLNIRNGSLFLSSGDDNGTGTKYNERIHGQDGNDTLVGRDGNDILRGGAGNDLLLGGNGNDLLASGSGNDRLIGGKGDDRLILQHDSDDDGPDSLIGGSGSDTFIFDQAGGSDPAVVKMGPGRDKLHFKDDAGLIVLEDYSRRDTIFLDYLSDARNPEYQIEIMVRQQQLSDAIYPDLPYRGTLLREGGLKLLFVGYDVGEIKESDFVF
ncbi:hypothetical protein CVM52_11655 [Pseudooceanicola lipolyticus]|uniref:Calcium-binding protein n=1 Tax=Pseudooceanicola lipolyticus TaxID=2029104 RepID=A0A2M8J180_9RHOB|nr:calcium-binding protein [Pseudooceanicola lipolyticus]PJE36539.1 hypothetical protein CVM52_11655 [Pseudooceanicola lipolyticus]